MFARSALFPIGKGRRPAGNDRSGRRDHRPVKPAARAEEADFIYTFVPRAVIRRCKVGPKIGEVLVRDRLVTELSGSGLVQAIPSKIDEPGDSIDLLCSAARRSGAGLAIGGTLYLHEGGVEVQATLIDVGESAVLFAIPASVADRDRLFGFLEGGGMVILPEPQPLLTKASRMPGLDGQKMSKSYHNTIPLDALPDVVEQQLRTMPTSDSSPR